MLIAKIKFLFIIEKITKKFANKLVSILMKPKRYLLMLIYFVGFLNGKQQQQVFNSRRKYEGVLAGEKCILNRKRCI